MSYTVRRGSGPGVSTEGGNESVLCRDRAEVAVHSHEPSDVSRADHRVVFPTDAWLVSDVAPRSPTRRTVLDGNSVPGPSSRADGWCFSFSGSQTSSCYRDGSICGGRPADDGDDIPRLRHGAHCGARPMSSRFSQTLPVVLQHADAPRRCCTMFGLSIGARLGIARPARCVLAVRPFPADRSLRCGVAV